MSNEAALGIHHSATTNACPPIQLVDAGSVEFTADELLVLGVGTLDVLLHVSLLGEPVLNRRPVTAIVRADKAFRGRRLWCIRVHNIHVRDQLFLRPAYFAALMTSRWMEQFVVALQFVQCDEATWTWCSRRLLFQGERVHHAMIRFFVERERVFWSGQELIIEIIDDEFHRWRRTSIDTNIADVLGLLMFLPFVAPKLARSGEGLATSVPIHRLDGAQIGIFAQVVGLDVSLKRVLLAENLAAAVPAARRILLVLVRGQMAFELRLRGEGPATLLLYAPIGVED